MRVLLDTHVLLWALSDPGRLSRRARELLAMPSTHRVLSSVSCWEIALLVVLGRIRIDAPLTEFFERAIQDLELEELPVTRSHAVTVAGLPSIHRDPFDRLLIAQAADAGLAIVSADREIARYPVEVVW